MNGTHLRVVPSHTYQDVLEAERCRAREAIERFEEAERRRQERQRAKIAVVGMALCVCAMVGITIAFFGGSL